VITLDLFLSVSLRLHPLGFEDRKQPWQHVGSECGSGRGQSPEVVMNLRWMRIKETFKRDHAEQIKYQFYQGISSIILYQENIVHDARFNRCFTSLIPVCVKGVFKCEAAGLWRPTCPLCFATNISRWSVLMRLYEIVGRCFFFIIVNIYSQLFWWCNTF